MDSHSHIPLLTSITTIYFFFLTTLPQSHSQENDPYRDCRQSFNCGTITKISYPFFGENRRHYCGSDGFELECWSNKTTFIRIGLERFKVLEINQTAHTMRIVREEIFYNGCEVTNTSLKTTLFRSLPTNQNVTIFYGCKSEYSKDLNYFKCSPEDEKFAYYLNDTELPKFPALQKQCRARFQVPALSQFPLEPEGGFNELKEALEKGFDVEYIANWTSCEKCSESGGICGSHKNDSSQFFCHFRTRNGIKWNTKAIVGVSAAAVAGAIAVSIAFYFFLRQKKKRYATSYEQSRSMSSDPSLKDPEKGSKYFGLPLFTYDELEEATNYFDSDKELGDGGFGTVYFGKLRDGRLVAVKRLYENNYRRLEQFMNEVEILTRLRHQNLVSLYGCTSRHSRELLLVYEYISNGTVADHLHGEQAKPRILPWNVRMSIAIETATALAYLHASDIIHRDVKTNNILLDNHFVVKVADFGLSRLFPTDVTHISTAPQGTPGYVDPEYHECYQLTDKSDVYSFGVVLIELISSLPAVDITRHRHEINLSNMAITKIQNRALHELVDPTIGFESDYKVRKMINAVAELAFQCLQNLREMRPSMEEVFGRLKEIQSDGQDKTKAEEMDISSADDVVLLKNEPPPASPDSHLMSTFTTPNASG